MHSYQIIERGTPLTEARKALILLHGRGASAANILPLADEFRNDSFYVVAPQATNNAWYPYTFLSPVEKNEPWLTSSITLLRRLIDSIVVHIPATCIYLMGFSQGACLALEFASRNATRYAGIAAFSGGLIGDKVRPETYNGNFDSTKIFIGNSDIDPHIPLNRCEESRDIVRSLGADVRFHVYPGIPHTIIREEIDDVRNLMF
jgi:phospholipase/carboxylesterase